VSESPVFVDVSEAGKKGLCGCAALLTLSSNTSLLLFLNWKCATWNSNQHKYKAHNRK